MSAVSDFFTQPGFWSGVPFGVVASAVVAGTFNLVSSGRSDKRKASLDTTIQTRKEDHDRELDQKKADREQKERNEQIVFEAATDFASICSDICMKSVDVEGLFNFMRDAFNTEAGLPDPKAMEKMAFAQARTQEATGILVPFNKLKMVASPTLLQAATRLNASIIGLNQTVTQPFARPVAMKAAADEIDNFINVFRAECGREQYPPSQAQNDAMSFMSTLKKHVDAFVEEAKTEMRQAGFQSTPWDNR